MTLQELKKSINDKSYSQEFIIMKCEDTDFVPMQYVKEIGSITKREIRFVDSIGEVHSGGGFFVEEPIYVLRTDKVPKMVSYNKDLIIITFQLSDDIIANYKDYIIQVPKLEQWMVEDYILSKCGGLSDKSIKWFTSRYKDIYKIEQEIDKISIFPKDAQESIFKMFVCDGAFSPSDNETAIELSHALEVRDIDGAKEIISAPSYDEIDEMPFIAYFQNTIKNRVKVWLNKNPTEENTGLRSNQIYVINKLKHVFSKEKLINMFETLSLLDSKIKNGLFPIENAVDYIVVKTFSDN